MPDVIESKPENIMKSLDEIRDKIFYEYKDVKDLRAKAKPPVSDSLTKIENALKHNVMMVNNLRKTMKEYFNNTPMKPDIGKRKDISTKEGDVKSQLKSTITNVDKLWGDIRKDKEDPNGELEKQIEEKYKKREQALIQKLKEKRREDRMKFQEHLKKQEDELRKELMTTIENVDKLRQEITEGTKILEEDIRNDITHSSKEHEKDMVNNLEIRMKKEISELETKYQSRINLLDSELQRAQRRIKELRNK
ncbi:MAG: hypothetical protein JSV49_04035 [Thermoplasmata archaeon]|nr:MAG: hypothetical protein JSV49_04035 [Thermoplasmata archaeon]